MNVERDVQRGGRLNFQIWILRERIEVPCDLRIDQFPWSQRVPRGESRIETNLYAADTGNSQARNRQAYSDIEEFIVALDRVEQLNRLGVLQCACQMDLLLLIDRAPW